MMPLGRTGALTFVCVAASLIVGILMVLLYKIEEQPPSAPVPTQGQLTPEQAANAIATWEAQIVALLQRNMRYPESARARGEQGVVQVFFILDRNGRVVRSSVLRSSGSSLLDEEALALLLRAEPFPAPPREVPGEQVERSVPIRFTLK